MVKILIRICPKICVQLLDYNILWSARRHADKSFKQLYFLICQLILDFWKN